VIKINKLRKCRGTYISTNLICPRCRKERHPENICKCENNPFKR